MPRPRPRDHRWRIIASFYGAAIVMVLLVIGILSEIGGNSIASAFHIHVSG